MEKDISINHLHLYKSNPRLPKTETEEEALFSIVDDQQGKLAVLAKDIAEIGMSPLELIAVFPAEQQGHYYVAEGNRRVTALKLIHNPSLVQDYSPGLFKAFSEIKPSDEVDLLHVRAVIFESENDPSLVRYMELRHMGEQGGKGTVTWNAEQKARFDALHNGDNPLLSFFEELMEREFLTEDQVKGVTKTNWERILRPIGLKFLNLDKQNGKFVIPEDDRIEEFTRKIRLIADQLHGESVAKVYANEQIEKFFSEIQALYNSGADSNGSPIPRPLSQDPSSATYVESDEPEGASESGDNPNEDNDDGAPHDENKDDDEDTGNEPGTDSQPNPPVPPDPYRNCKTVIPNSLRLQSRNARISKIIDELKHLEVEQFPNACGTLLRALIELSAKEYLEHHSIESDATKIDFAPAISRVCKELVSNSLIDRYYSSSVHQNIEPARQLFNGYMHNTVSYPSSIVIQDTFKVFETFIMLCLA